MSTTSTPATADDVRVTPAPPFDFGQSLRFLDAFPAMTGEQAADDVGLRFVLRAGGTTVGARVTADRHDLAYRLFGPDDLPLAPAVVVAATAAISHFLSVDDDLGPFYERAADDPPMARVVARLHGLHQVKFPSPLELLVWAILVQRVRMPIARRMKDAIVAHVGNEAVVDGRRLAAFPDADQLLALDVDELTALIGNATKAERIAGAVAGFAALDPDRLRTAPTDAVRDELLALPGIGPWSASFLLIRGLGRMEDAIADPASLRAAARVYQRPVDAGTFARLAERYDGCGGYWTHYLRVARG